jgi:hypothetical protein
MQRLALLTLTLAAIAAVFSACGDAGANGRPAPGSPTEAYHQLYAAVKAKDTEAIKALMSKKSQDLAMMASQKNKVPIEKVYENGFTATTFSPTLPEIRDERVKDDMASIEVWNSKDNLWEDLALVHEDGGWKFAFGDLFAGSFKSPGKGRAQIEREAANAMGNNMIEVKPAGDANLTLPANSVNPVPPPPANATPVKPRGIPPMSQPTPQ